MTPGRAWVLQAGHGVVDFGHGGEEDFGAGIGAHGQAKTITGYKDRQARTVLSALLIGGYLDARINLARFWNS